MILSESTKRNLCLLPGVLALAYVLGMQACRSQRDSEPSVEAVVRANASAPPVAPVPAGPLPSSPNGNRQPQTAATVR